MKKIRKIYIPSICITFTMAILWSCIWNVLKGNWLEGFALFVFQILGYLVITHAVVALFIDKINFKKYWHYFVTEMSAFYVVMLVFGYWGNWFAFRLSTFLCVTLLFWAIGGYVHFYFYSLNKADAEEINELLKKREL